MTNDDQVLSKCATFRFYADLNDFLPPHRQQKPITHTFDLDAAVKDMIEALGVPHPEIELILANGQPVDFAYPVRDGDRIAVYPFFTSLPPDRSHRLRPPQLDPPRFVLDVHLGQLARYLRMLGFDTLYRNDFDDETLAHLSSAENRILLTRDRGLLKRGIVVHGYCLRTTQPRQQLLDVIERFSLAESIKPFRRCINCNGLLQPVEKRTVIDHVPPSVYTDYADFHRCRGCGQIYWKGSHFSRMEQFIAGVLAS